MSKPRTVMISIPTLQGLADPWTRETHRLTADFRVDFDRQRGRGASHLFADNYVLLASDWLLEQFGEHAHWDRLDVLAMLDRFDDVLRVPGRKERVIAMLGAFYCYLGNIGRVSPEMHRRMRQLSLDCCMLGLDTALAKLAEDRNATCVTRPLTMRRDPRGSC